MSYNNKKEVPAMPDQHTAHEVAKEIGVGNGSMWLVIFLMVMGTIGRTLVSNEPFDVKRFSGEVILSVIGAIMLYSFGLLQGMSIPQIILLGSLGSLGGLRILEWLIRLAKQIKDN